MLDLVLWSFVVALTPSALGLAWGGIRGVRHFIHFGHSGTVEGGSPTTRDSSVLGPRSRSNPGAASHRMHCRCLERFRHDADVS